MFFQGRVFQRFGPKGGILSLFFMVCIKELLCLGMKYPFPRPVSCLKEGCKSKRLWGHGFRDSYFEGYASALLLKRYVCADCGCVYILRPFGYWPRHHVPVRIIFRNICHRIKHGVWDRSCFSRQRQGHWLRALRNNILKYLGMAFSGSLMEGFFELLHKMRVPAARSR